MPRSRRRSSISSRQTRSIAGASCLGVLGGDAVEHFVDRDDGHRQRGACDGKRVFGLEPAVELGLGAMEQAAARQRVHADDRLGLVPRFQPMNRREQELVRTTRETLQRGERIRALGQPVRLQRFPDAVRAGHQTVARRPDGAAAGPPADDRAAQRLVQREQVVGVALDRRGIPRVEERLQRREVVFQVVDRAVGIDWRRPRQARAGLLRCVGRQHTMIGNGAGNRPHHVERIERRDAGARFGHVEPRIREVEPF